MRSRSANTSGGGSRQDARFDELYRLYYRPVRDYCRRRVASDLVDDAVAETFLTAWRRLAEVPDGEKALMWSYGVAFRVVGHQWRSTARRRRLEVRLLIEQFTNYWRTRLFQVNIFSTAVVADFATWLATFVVDRVRREQSAPTPVPTCRSQRRM
jgi:DNA-directed RNA polymerase specialized sigma24 family protein